MISLCARDSAGCYIVIYVNLIAILQDIIMPIFIDSERLNTCLRSYRLGRTGIQTQVHWIPYIFFPSNDLIYSIFKFLNHVQFLQVKNLSSLVVSNLLFNVNLTKVINASAQKISWISRFYCYSLA